MAHMMAFAPERRLQTMEEVLAGLTQLRTAQS